MSWSAAGDKFKNPWSKKKNRIPAISVSALDCLTQGFNFVVSMNEFTYGFKEVSNIEVENPCDTIQEGGVNDHVLVVGKPESNDKTLTFKRGLILRAPTLISSAAKAAAARIPNNIGRRAALIAVNALDPQESLESGPSLGIIQVYSRTNELTGLYKFISVGLKSWKLDDLSATDDSILIEEITVYHTGLSRMPVTLKPALFVPSSYSDSRDAWDADEAAKRWEEARKKNAEKRKENEENLKKDAEARKEEAKVRKEAAITKNLEKKKENEENLEKDAKARREESEKRKLNAETQKMLDEAKRVLGDDFEEIAGDLNLLLDGEGSTEEKLKRLEEEKTKLKEEVKKYHDNTSSSIESGEKNSEDNIESTVDGFNIEGMGIDGGVNVPTEFNI